MGGGASPATSDEYLRAFHDPAYRLRPRYLAARITASVATLGSGGGLGLEGPSMYGGSALGTMIQRRLPKPFRGSDHRTLLVAGAAAGVAAIFKAPATGAIFALEVPYRDDMARRMLLPALVASATGYLTFVTLSDTVPLLSVGEFGITSFNLIDLLGALLVGAACAIGARAFAKLMRIAKGFSLRALPLRLVVSSLSLVGLFFLSRELTGLPLSLGAGYEVFRDWLFVERGGDIAVWLLIAVFFIRCLASALTTAGSGVGGVFISARRRWGIDRSWHRRGDPSRPCLVVHAARHRGVPRRRIPGAARRRDVRRRDDRQTELRRAGPVRRSRGRTGDGRSVDHSVPAPSRHRLSVLGADRWLDTGS